MNEYNLNVLTWGEFEEFTKDLLSEEMGVSFQSFADGADGGIDLRYSACDNDRTIIVQCKRYKSVSGLMANLAKERLKLDEMSPAPERYILSVSLDLTESKIDDIVTLFSPYIKQSSDVVTPKQLNSLLHKHPNVEKRHYKLWIASSNVLQAILSSRVSNYSGLIKEKIIDTLETYSPTPSFNEAMLTLKEHGFIVIAGEPGVGKTTLADVMSYYLLGEGDFNELVALPQDINDALEMMSSDPDKKQIFLFDDFLGSNYLDDKLSRREDGIFRTLIENAGRLRKNKALIMTTREYILHQAQQSTEVFKDQGFLDAKYIVDLSEYDLVTKAKILYNHLAVSDIPEEHLEYFVDKKVYRSIVRHRNYNPRLIEAINKQKLWSDCLPESFCDKVIELFNNPWMLYEDIYMNKIDENARNIMLVMMSIGRNVRFEYLHKAVVSFDDTIDETQLRRSIDVLESTFLKTSKDKDDQIVVDVLNPTIYDFITHYYRGHNHSIEKLIRSAVYLNQLTHPFAISADSSSYELRASLSGYTPIVLSESGVEAMKGKVLSSWQQLPWLGNSGTPESFDIFDSISRLSDVSDAIEEVNQEFSRAVLATLQSSIPHTQDVSAALNAFDTYCDSDDLPDEVADNFVHSVVGAVGTYEDMKTVAEIGWSYGIKKFVLDRIAERIAQDEYYEDILSEEVRQRLTDGEKDIDIKDEMNDTLECYGLDGSFVDNEFNAWAEPPEDYDGSSFYSKDDDDFETQREMKSDENSRIDDVFLSLSKR